MIDTHAHLFDSQFDNDLQIVIDDCKKSNIQKIILPATNIATSKICLDLNAKNDFLLPAVGIHPHEVKDISDIDLNEISDLAKNKNVIAIGEIGIDYFYDFAPKEKQIEVFSKQIDIAIKNNLPIIIHTRDSISDTIEIIEKFVNQNPNWKINNTNFGLKNYRGVFHCFTGTKIEAEKIFSLGFLIGIGGMITFKNNPMEKLILDIGIENVVLETDSPYLAPIPFRGKRNTPANLIYVANKLTEITGIDLNKIEEITNRNFNLLFGK